MISDETLLRAALKIQRREVNEYHVYIRLAKLCKDPRNAEILRTAGEAERRHAAFWKGKTGIEVQPGRIHVFITLLLARLLGLTFTLKQMEKNEGTASKIYMEFIEYFPEVKSISMEEAAHEKALLDMLDEEMLQYIGSIVLGLNDALVELTGALAGFTLALGSTAVISLAGLVTGISAAFSMAASDYLSSKAENNPRAVKSALYTGGAYIITVLFLILPFLLLSSKFAALGITMAAAVFIIFIFNYYLATAKDLNFKRRFMEMTLISLGVAGLSFAIGWALKIVLGVDV